MSIAVHLFYTGEKGNARRFAQEMISSGTVAKIRSEEGNEAYHYYFPMEDPETVLLIDQWRDQAALDIHHASPMMAEILALRAKYGLTVRAERFVSDAMPEQDRAFVAHKGN